MRSTILFFSFIFLVSVIACERDTDENAYTPYQLEIPSNFPKFNLPEDNPMTVEGIALGKKLFYEKRLSGDLTQSCGSCHRSANAFSDTGAVSVGIDGLSGNRSAMPIINLLWAESLFWDGRSESMEDQALGPVVNPIEMHETWPNAVAKLQDDPYYPAMFLKAFGTDDIDSNLVAKAISQFERTMISGNSKFDKYWRNEVGLTDQELAGFDLFMIEGPIDGNPNGADCFHCHDQPLFTDNLFHNNGLDIESDWTDMGRYDVTNNPLDKAKFKTPTLRNLVFTAPYMHDGRFKTLEEVIDFYNTGGHVSSTLDPLMKNPDTGLLLSDEAKANLLAFLLTLTDSSFIENTDFQE